MAGELAKSTALTNYQNNYIRLANKRLAGDKKTGRDDHTFAAATELEAADNTVFLIPLPSAAIIDDIQVRNDDMDTGCAATLVADFGVAAAMDYESVTGGTVTQHAQDDIVDADLFVDGSTVFQTATAEWTSLAADATTWGLDNGMETLWENLGYDRDPNTTFYLVFQSQAASSALAAAAKLEIRVDYVVD